MKCDALKPTVWAELNDLLQTRGFFYAVSSLRRSWKIVCMED